MGSDKLASRSKVVGAKVVYDAVADKFEFRLAAPVSVRWQLSTLCNLSCVYCISDSGPRGDPGFDPPTMIRILGKLADAGVIRLDFTGGEPLIRRDLGDLLRAARERDMSTIVTTNALVLDDERVRYLKAYATLVQVSVDGPKHAHEWQRGPGVFEKTVANIRRLADAGCNVRMNSFLYKSNTEHLEYLLDLSKSLGCSHLFLMFSAQGRGVGNEHEIISGAENARIKARIANYAVDSGRYVRVYDYAEYEHACVLLTADGYVESQALHQRDCVRVGNILEDSLSELFASEHFDHFGHVSHYLRSRRARK
jgi:MoaA/NifB/PqqE/SkfB family radical SAM enzyme